MKSQKSYDGKPIFYLIPTPIGNLEDITIRCLNVLNEVEFLLCEDTRVTSILLKKYNIKKPLYRCDQYSEQKMREKVLSALASGYNVGLVSDAGTPIISDPGYVVAKYVMDAGYNVVSLPGATAFVPALSVSGIVSSCFIFIGFLDSKKGKRERQLEDLKSLEQPLIFYESPHHLKETLIDIYSVFGDRNIALCRELTKIHEEIIRGKVSECIDEFDNIKGEFVLIVEGNTEKMKYNFSVLEHVNLYINDGMKPMDAIKLVAKERGVSKSAIYNEYNKSK